MNNTASQSNAANLVSQGRLELPDLPEFLPELPDLPEFTTNRKRSSPWKKPRTQFDMSISAHCGFSGVTLTAISPFTRMTLWGCEQE
jgi:hypothetical protein